MQSLDALSYQSRWRQRDPVAKFALWVLMMILAMCLPSIGRAVLLLCIAAFTCWLLRVSPFRYLKWLLIPFSFLAVGLVAIIISFARSPDNLLWCIQIGQYWIGLDPIGLSTANETFWRSMTALAATFWLMLNMPFEQLIKLMKRGRLPLVLIEQILLTWRFIFIFLEEAAAIYHTQSLRFGYRNLRTSYRSLAMLVTMLFSRVMMRYQRMSVALNVKLYQGDFHL
ncbi:energy-coupling factor ABC transporter transmembrane protein [Providencia stuartii]|uniref:Energy-coupling factor ABC transporter transmembrane protein n=1 Tax=Providencia stuartii TaxID=588 RepID=A0AAJ1JL33_PROST|nr:MULTISPECIES: energy-coupling factor ABC transporter transmembrane protein [Providencia]EMA3640664.1 energy-coupling factor ABC transporter transmembrane protein [Providencia stuartii]MBW3099519.1 energy-coupling factor ABC transporter transmembrane protein [Providencia stuartii]MCB5215732.1 energy-coupling factor ABC transporter transmembrane protein [Providencia stuartii]MDE8749462.1 energy-coupling factor ABC transporter transmembrane protein [Providencia thailandensis]MDE8769265.1 energ